MLGFLFLMAYFTSCAFFVESLFPENPEVASTKVE